MYICCIGFLLVALQSRRFVPRNSLFLFQDDKAYAMRYNKKKKMIKLPFITLSA